MYLLFVTCITHITFFCIFPRLVATKPQTNIPLLKCEAMRLLYKVTMAPFVLFSMKTHRLSFSGV